VPFCNPDKEDDTVATDLGKNWICFYFKKLLLNR
jgi:hypothetical protein